MGELRARSRARLGLVLTLATGLLARVASSAGAEPPAIGAQWVTGVAGADATLHAVIDPNGLTTAYELQIDTSGRFRFFEASGGCPLAGVPMVCTAAISFGDPLAPGLVQPPEFILAAGGGRQSVSVEMAAIGAALQPGTTYHYRAIASNGWVVVEGAGQTFTTPAPPAPAASGPAAAAASLGTEASGATAGPRVARRAARRCRHRGRHRGRRSGHRRRSRKQRRRCAASHARRG